MEKVVGILGGMGPEATADLFQKIISFTDADSDQEHLRIIVENNVKIPDRTRYILGDGEDPLKYLIKSAIKLELMGANILAMPCNTAHYFYDKIVDFIDVPFINMIDEVAKTIYDTHSENAKVGLLATKGTYAANIYDKACSKYGISVVKPENKHRDGILDLIYDVKRGQKDFDLDLIRNILREFGNQDIYTIILGCTELPLIFNNLSIEEASKYNFIDATSILAQRIVEIAKCDEGVLAASC